jgi:glycine oxidase
LAGCTLAMTFFRKNIPFKLAGTSIEGEASMASSGLITPVTGRKYVKSWMIDEFIASALDFYQWTEEILGNRYFFPVDIVRFLSHPEALAAWDKRKKDPEYQNYISEKRLEELDVLDRPYGILTGGYRLDTPGWIKSVRSFLKKNNFFEETYVDPNDSFQQYEGVIYATGATNTSISNGLIPNKGEALIVKLPEWKFPAIVKEEVFFIPIGEENVFWVGSNYKPWPENSRPSVEGKQSLIKAIEHIYPGSFVILEHLSGIRPTIDDRRPLVGLYPGHHNKFLFNGMGTKGTSLAPFWADHLVSHLINKTPILKIVNPLRYQTQQSG